MQTPDRRRALSRRSSPITWSTCASRLLDREINRLSSDISGTGERRQHVVSLDTEATRLTVHRVIGLPDCPSCAGPGDPSTPTALETGDLPTLLTQLEGWLDPLTGVIPQLRLEQPFGDHTALPTHCDCRCAAADFERRTTRTADRVGQGPRSVSRGDLRDRGGHRAVFGITARRPTADLVPRRRARPATCSIRAGSRCTPTSSIGAPVSRSPATTRACRTPGSGDAGTERIDPVWVPAVLCYLRLRLRPHQMVVQGSSN